MIFFLRQRYLILALYGILDKFTKSFGNPELCLGRLPCVTAVFLDVVKFVDHPLVAVHESRADRGDIAKVKSGRVAALRFFDDFVACCVRSGSLLWAQLDGDVCEWRTLMEVAAVEGGESMVTVYVSEEEVSQLFDLVFPKHHFGQLGARLAAAAAELGRRSDWTRFAVWVRPALGVLQTIDEVADVVAAAEVGEDYGEAVHRDG